MAVMKASWRAAAWIGSEGHAGQVSRSNQGMAGAF